MDYLEGDNATLLCHVSQKRRKDSLLAVRWFFAGADSPEALMVKMTKLRIVQYYGNFSRSAHRQRLRLLEEQRGVLYRLLVLMLRPADQGQYVCRVQEISKHRNKWTAWSNGSSATEMRGKTAREWGRGRPRVLPEVTMQSPLLALLAVSFVCEDLTAVCSQVSSRTLARVQRTDCNQQGLSQEGEWPP